MYEGLTLSTSNSEVLNLRNCKSILTTDILNSSRPEINTNALKSPKRNIIGQVNINLLRNKIELLVKNCSRQS